MINDQKLLQFIDHVETRLNQIAGYTEPRNITVKVDNNPAFINGELLTHNQRLRHEGKPYDRVKAAEADLVAAQKKHAAKHENFVKAQAELREAEKKVSDLADHLADERKYYDFIHYGR